MLFLLSILLPMPTEISAQPIQSSDWSMFRGNPTHTGYSNTTGPEQASLIWRYQTSYDWMYHRPYTVDSSPAVVNGKLYVGSSSDYIYCLNSHNRSQIWSYKTGDAVISSPAVVDDRVYVGSKNGVIYCLNSDSGNLIWAYSHTTGSVLSSPTVVDARVYVGSLGSHAFYCLDADNGSLLWKCSMIGSIECSPAVVDGKVYIGSSDSKIYCLNTSNGNGLWNYTTGDNVYSSPAIFDGKAYIGSDDDYVYCLDTTNGGPIWSFQTGGDVKSSPAIFNDRVYVGSLDNYIYCLNASTGDLIWRYRTGSEVHSSPAIAYDEIYVGSSDHRVYCLDADDGSLKWYYTTDGPIKSSPAVVDGRLYVGSADGYAYCIGEGEPYPSYSSTLDARGTHNVLLQVNSNDPIEVNVTDAEIPSDAPFESPSYEILSVFRIETNISFGFVITMFYDYSDVLPATAGRLNESSLLIHFLDETQLRWWILPTIRDTSSNELIGMTVFPAIFVVTGQVQNILPPNNNDHYDGGFSQILLGLAIPSIAILIVILSYGFLKREASMIKPRASPEIELPYEEEVSSGETALEVDEFEPSESVLPSDDICSHCGHANPRGAVFCIRCGRYLE